MELTSSRNITGLACSSRNKHVGLNSVYLISIIITPNKHISPNRANLRFLYTNRMLIVSPQFVWFLFNFKIVQFDRIDDVVLFVFVCLSMRLCLFCFAQSNECCDVYVYPFVLQISIKI